MIILSVSLAVAFLLTWVLEKVGDIPPVVVEPEADSALRSRIRQNRETLRREAEWRQYLRTHEAEQCVVITDADAERLAEDPRAMRVTDGDL